MTTPIPPSLERFGAELNRAAIRELSPRSGSVRARLRQARPRVLAAGTLCLASAAAALALALGTSTTPPAFAVVRHHDGSVSVKINRRSGIAGANRKLGAMGIDQRIADRKTSRGCSLNSVPTVTVTVPRTGARPATRRARTGKARTTGPITVSGTVAVAICTGVR